MFRDPAWGDTATVLGYPPVPQVRDQAEGSPNLIVQGGEVVNPAATGLFGEPLFLYSAIARPGNSGGPIVAQDGRVIGLVFEGSAASGTTGVSEREKGYELRQQQPTSLSERIDRIEADVARVEAVASEAAERSRLVAPVAGPPFFRGIRSRDVVQAIDDLGFEGLAQMEDWLLPERPHDTR